MKDNPIHRQIRRDSAREALIGNHATMKARTYQLFRGLFNLGKGLHMLGAGMADTLAGTIGLSAAGCAEIINLFRANRRLNTICNGTAGLGCDADGRLMYGSNSRKLKPLSVAQYKAERLNSYKRWPYSEEASCFSIRTRNAVAHHRVANPEEYWETKEGKRVAAKAKQFEKKATKIVGEDIV